MKEEDKNKANELIDRFIPEEECGINRSCAKVACVCMADWKKNRMIEKAVEYIEDNIHDYYDGDSEFAVCNWLKKDEFVANFKKAMCDE